MKSAIAGSQGPTFSTNETATRFSTRGSLDWAASSRSANDSMRLQRKLAIRSQLSYQRRPCAELPIADTARRDRSGANWVVCTIGVVARQRMRVIRRGCGLGCCLEQPAAQRWHVGFFDCCRTVLIASRGRPIRRQSLPRARRRLLLEAHRCLHWRRVGAPSSGVWRTR